MIRTDLSDQEDYLKESSPYSIDTWDYVFQHTGNGLSGNTFDGDGIGDSGRKYTGKLWYSGFVKRDQENLGVYRDTN